MAAPQPEAREVEEHYILRVKNAELAEQIRATLQGRSEAEGKMQIQFEDDDKHGKLVFNGVAYPLSVLSLPSVTETYKTYDDTNYVKVTDVGQVLVVGEPEAAGPSGSGGAGGESADGVTPPMRNARNRLFKRQIDVDPDMVSKVEYNLLTILAGGAPEGMKFVDYEEEYRINAETGLGEWVPVAKR